MWPNTISEMEEPVEHMCASVLIVSSCFSIRYDGLCVLLRHSKSVRSWFAHSVLFAFPTRFSEYLLECPSAEVRGAFAKLIVFIAHFSLLDGPCPAPVTSPGASTQVRDEQLK